MHFDAVAYTFDQIEATSSRLEMTRLLAELLKGATPSEAALICNLSLGQLHPPYVGTQFNVAEKNMYKVVARLLGESEHAIQTQAKKQGDLGLVVAHGSWRTREQLTVHQVYKALYDIERMSGTGSQEEKINALEQVLRSLDPLSAKYVVRVVLGKLRLGFSDMTLIDACSWMETGDKSLRATIERAYNVCADIGYIVATLKEKGVKALEHMHMQVGIPVRPAAAERLPTAQAIIDKIGHCFPTLRMRSNNCLQNSLFVKARQLSTTQIQGALCRFKKRLNASASMALNRLPRNFRYVCSFLTCSILTATIFLIKRTSNVGWHS
jgi:DNA ligase-1